MAFLGQAAAHPRNFSSLSLPLPRYSPDVWKLIRWLLVQNPAARPTADEIMGLEMVRAVPVGSPALCRHPVFHAFWLGWLARRWPAESWSWRW